MSAPQVPPARAPARARAELRRRAAALARAAMEVAAARTAPPATGPVLDTPDKAAERLGRLRSLPKEHVVAVYLNARGREIGEEAVSVGTLTASLIHPREVFAPAVRAGAAGVLVGHNHPSGDPAPSREDREATERLRRAGEILGIPLLDHLILTEEGSFSFRAHGLL